MTFGKRLQKALDLSKCSRKKLASELGVSPQAIGMVITGGGKIERKLSPENTRKAARLLKVDFEWLSTGETAPPANGPPAVIDAPALSPDALQLAKYFDKIPEGMGKVIARQACMQVIIDALHEPDPPQTLAPGQVERRGKRHA